MKNDDTFSRNEPPPTPFAHVQGGNSDGSTLSSPPLMERQLSLRYNVRLPLVAMLVLVVLAGGYGVFRAVSSTSPQASSAFQQAHCPFPLAGLVEGQNVKCGFLTVPEDRS